MNRKAIRTQTGQGLHRCNSDLFGKNVNMFCFLMLHQDKVQILILGPFMDKNMQMKALKLCK